MNRFDELDERGLPQRLRDVEVRFKTDRLYWYSARQ